MTDPTDHPDPKEATEAKLCAYLEGELPPADRAEIERHLAANPQHKLLLAELAKTRNWMRSIPRVSAPSDLAESFQGQVERNMLLDPTPVNAAPRRMPQWWLAAAMILLVLGLGALVTLILLPNKSNLAINNPGSTGGKMATTDNSVADRVPADKSAGSTTPPGSPAPIAPTATPLGTGNYGAALPDPVPPAPATPAPGALGGRTGKDDALEKNSRDGFADLKAKVGQTEARTDQFGYDAVKAAEAQAWTPPISALKGPADDHTIFVVVRTADPRTTSGRARTFFDAGHLAFDSLEPGAPLLAMRNSADSTNTTATNAASPSDLQYNRQQLMNQAGGAPASKTRMADAQSASADTQPTTAPTAEVAAIAAHGLTRAQVDQLAAAVADPNSPGDVRIMLPDHGKYVDELTTTPIARGRTLLVVVPQLDKPGVDKSNIVKVADDGTVALPMIDPVPAAGSSPAALSRRIADQYREEHVILDAKVEVKLLPDESQPAKAGPATAPTVNAPATTGPIAEPADYTVVVVTEPPGR